MAVTKGRGNPHWTRDEVLLALNLYFDCQGAIPGPSDARVQALSAALRALPVHPAASKTDTFRNPDGVAFKLQNIRQIATGKGMGNVSNVDREVWATFGHRRAEVGALAARIVEPAGDPIDVAAALDDIEIEFREGRLLTSRHVRRERQRGLRKALVAHRRTTGALCCEGCGWRPHDAEDEILLAGFEAHHLQPLAWTGPVKTRLSDVTLLCATCHRIVHRAIARHGEWLTPERIKGIGHQ